MKGINIALIQLKLAGFSPMLSEIKITDLGESFSLPCARSICNGPHEFGAVKMKLENDVNIKRKET